MENKLSAPINKRFEAVSQKVGINTFELIDVLQLGMIEVLQELAHSKYNDVNVVDSSLSKQAQTSFESSQKKVKR